MRLKLSIVPRKGAERSADQDEMSALWSPARLLAAGVRLCLSEPSTERRQTVSEVSPRKRSALSSQCLQLRVSQMRRQREVRLEVAELALLALALHAHPVAPGAQVHLRARAQLERVQLLHDRVGHVRDLAACVRRLPPLARVVQQLQQLSPACGERVAMRLALRLDSDSNRPGFTAWHRSVT